MNRLNIINFINPSWYKQITEFLEEHPAFNKLLPIVALDEYPPGFNKNPHETDEDAPRNIFETVIYGIAHASVDVEYGKAEYLKMVDHLRKVETYTHNMKLPIDLKPNKKRTYRELINTLLDKNIEITELKYEQINEIETVWGIGESTITLLHLLYDSVDSDKVLPYSDKQFNRGMSMFYNLDKPTKKRLKEITDTWSNKKVGLMFIVQYAHYSEFV
jgi:hypothetical protein